MGRKNNRTCIICGNQYHYCPTCNEDYNKPTWYFIFDNQNCHDIYETCVSYRDNIISIKDAYEKLIKLDLSNLDNFVEPTKKQIDEILQYKEKVEVCHEGIEHSTGTSAKNNKSKK